MKFKYASSGSLATGALVLGQLFGYSVAQAEPRMTDRPIRHDLNREQCYFLGHTKLLSVPGPLSSVMPLAGGQALLLFRSGGKVEISRGAGNNPIRSFTSRDLKEVKEIDATQKVTEVHASPNGRFSLVTVGEAGFLVDTATLKVSKLSDDINGGFFSKDSRRLIAQIDGAIAVFDVATLARNDVATIGNRSVVAIDAQSENVFVINYQNFPSPVREAIWLAIEKGERRVIEGKDLSITRVSDKSPTVLVVNGDRFELHKPQWSRTGTTGIQTGNYNYSGGYTQSLSFVESGRKIDMGFPLGNWEFRPTLTATDDFVVMTSFRGNASSISLFEKKNFVCAKPVAIACYDCADPSGRDRSVRAYSDQGTGFLDKTLCESPFDARDPRWKPFSVPPKSVTDRAAVERWLIRMSKKGGFKASEHLGLLEGMLASDDISKGYGGLLSLVLSHVMAESSNLYTSLLMKYPSISKLPRVEAACLSPEEQKHYGRYAYAVLKRQLMLSHFDRPFSDYGYFSQFTPFLLDSEKDEIADLIGDGASRYAVQRDYNLRSVFFSKVYQFAYQNARRLMGLPWREITDISQGSKYGNTISTSLLGTSKISDKSTLIEAGFYMEPGPTFTYNPAGALEQTADAPWSHSGNNYAAKLVGKAIPVESNWILQEPSIRYKELLSDRVLRGVVVAGANLGGQKATLDEYRSYFEDLGFTFEKPVAAENFSDYLKGKVTGPDPMDYMIKEAHSDGDDKNLFRMSKQVAVVIGMKRTKDRTEVVELVYPTFDKGSELIPNALFGEWIRAREKSGIGQLVYVNGSCWSHHKAAAELSAARSPVLVEIATTTMAFTFVNHERSALYNLLTALREGATFAQMRERMTASPRYKSKKEDVYIFPDESEYGSLIAATLRTPFDLTISVFEAERSTGRMIPYHLDERIQ